MSGHLRRRGGFDGGGYAHVVARDAAAVVARPFHICAKLLAPHLPKRREFNCGRNLSRHAGTKPVVNMARACLPAYSTGQFGL